MTQVNSISVIILAAGEQKRWAPQGYKQMVEVEGIPVIHRTIDMARVTFGVEPWVAVREGSPFGLGLRYFYPVKHDLIFDTLESTSELWKRLTIILFGDVYYPQKALEIIRDTEKFAFGDPGDIYAVRFYAGEWQRLKNSISIARAGGGVKFWAVYRTWEGLSLDNHDFGNNFHRFYGMGIQDFDRLEQYQTFLNRVTT